MLYGDQWIYGFCGTHNLELRTKCRSCGEKKEDASVGEETWLEVMEKQDAAFKNKAGDHA